MLLTIKVAVAAISVAARWICLAACVGVTAAAGTRDRARVVLEVVGTESAARAAKGIIACGRVDDFDDQSEKNDYKRRREHVLEC